MILYENIDCIELIADDISKKLGRPISIDKDLVLVTLYPNKYQFQVTLQGNFNLS